MVSSIRWYTASGSCGRGLSRPRYYGSECTSTISQRASNPFEPLRLGSKAPNLVTNCRQRGMKESTTHTTRRKEEEEVHHCGVSSGARGDHNRERATNTGQGDCVPTDHRSHWSATVVGEARGFDARTFEHTESTRSVDRVGSYSNCASVYQKSTTQHRSTSI